MNSYQTLLAIRDAMAADDLAAAEAALNNYAVRFLEWVCDSTSLKARELHDDYLKMVKVQEQYIKSKGQ